MGLVLALEIVGKQDEVAGRHEIGLRLLKVPGEEGVGDQRIEFEAQPQEAGFGPRRGSKPLARNSPTYEPA